MKETGKQNKKAFLEGIRDGIPIALGYLAVAFSLGFTARKVGMNPLQGFISSVLNHASAGEYAEFTVIGANASYLEMAIIILVTNARYLLMSCALSQRFDEATGMLHRVFVGFGITDEIFGAAIGRSGAVQPWYNYGLMGIAIPFWATGTAMGIIAGNILPTHLVGALCVALYGMFLAIIVPPARQNKIVALAVIISFICSFIANVVPVVKDMSSSTRTIILTVVITGVIAMCFPIKDSEQEEAA